MPLKRDPNSLPRTESATFIRTAKIDDLAGILAVEQASPLAAHWNPDHYSNRIQTQPQGSCFLVVESEDKKVCGFLCARIVGLAGEWEVENVVVEENLRRQGIGGQLMQSLIKNWEASTGTSLLLEVRESNTGARALYRRYGLHEVGCRRAYYSDPSEDAILYARHRQQ